VTSQTAPPANLRLIGGEMVVWTDEPPTEPQAAYGSAAVATLVARAVPAGARVLLAGGGHPRRVLDVLAARAGRVTCLIRGYPDASALAKAYADEPTIDVLAGSLSRLPEAERFDAVVALAGLDRVASAEIDELDWAHTLDRLLAVLRPSGTLLLALDNPMGLHRLVALDPRDTGRDDGAWTVPGGPDPSCATGLGALRERLATAGVGVDACYAAYPTLERSGVLVDAVALDAAGSPDGLLDATLATAYADAASPGVQLRDPRPLARAARRAGLAASLAPAWMVVARRTDEARSGQGLPALLCDDTSAGPRWRTLIEATSGTDGWVRRGTVVASEPAGRAGHAGAVRRDPGRLSGAVPTGDLLSGLLLDAGLRRDRATLRRLLSGYAGWLTSVASADERLPGVCAFATPANVVVDGGRFAVLDPSWQLTEPLPVDVAVARGLRQHAVTVVTSSYAHPWSSTLDVDGLTVVLAGLAGNPVERNVIAAAVDAEASIVAALDGLTDAQRVALAERLARISVIDPPPGLASYDQLREAWQRQREEVVRLADRLAWSEKILDSRERALKKAQLTIALLSGSLSFRLGRLLITPARLGKRWYRRTRGRIRRLRRALSREG
jgi:hypothetical protein